MDEFLQRFPRAALLVDDALTVLAANLRAAQLFGFGNSPDLVDELTQWLATQELGDELALATATLTGPADEETFEWRNADRHFEVSVCWEADGEHFLVFLIDVTDARLTERIHMDARHYLEALLADIPLGLAVLDVHQNITFANRQMRELCNRLTGRGDLIEIIGASIEQLAPEPTGTRWQSICAVAMEADATKGDERETLLDGDLVISAQAQPLHDHRVHLTGVILVVEDVTEQARLEGELIRMEKLATVGEMVITVNHEINNPLVIISTNAQSLRLMNKELDDKSKKKIERIENQVKRISDVTERLRTMEEVTSSEYIADGPAMVDIWGKSDEADSDPKSSGEEE